jgi:hypothetical protein
MKNNKQVTPFVSAEKYLKCYNEGYEAGLTEQKKNNIVGGEKMQHKDIVTLEQEWKKLLENITITRTKYNKSKENKEDAEYFYRKSKSQLNKAYKEWKETRKEALRAYRRYKSYPYQVRKWNIQNMEKALSMIMEKKL